MNFDIERNEVLENNVKEILKNKNLEIVISKMPILIQEKVGFEIYITNKENKRKVKVYLSVEDLLKF